MSSCSQRVLRDKCSVPVRYQHCLLQSKCCGYIFARPSILLFSPSLLQESLLRLQLTKGITDNKVRASSLEGQVHHYQTRARFLSQTQSQTHSCSNMADSAHVSESTHPSLYLDREVPPVPPIQNQLSRHEKPRR